MAEDDEGGLQDLQDVVGRIKAALTLNADNQFMHWNQLSAFLDDWDRAEDYRRNNVAQAQGLRKLARDPEVKAVADSADWKRLQWCIKQDQSDANTFLYYALGLYMRKHHIYHVLAHDKDFPSEPATAQALYDDYFSDSAPFFDKLPADQMKTCLLEKQQMLKYMDRIKVMLQKKGREDDLVTLSQKFRTQQPIHEVLVDVDAHLEKIVIARQAIERVQKALEEHYEICADLDPEEPERASQHAEGEDDELPPPLNFDAPSILTDAPPAPSNGSKLRKRKRQSSAESARRQKRRVTFVELPRFINEADMAVLRDAQINSWDPKTLSKALGWEPELLEFWHSVYTATNETFKQQLAETYPDFEEDLKQFNELSDQSQWEDLADEEIDGLIDALPNWSVRHLAAWVEIRYIDARIRDRTIILPLVVSAEKAQILERAYKKQKGAPLSSSEQKAILQSFPDGRQGWKVRDIRRWFEKRFQKAQDDQNKRAKKEYLRQQSAASSVTKDKSSAPISTSAQPSPKKKSRTEDDPRALTNNLNYYPLIGQYGLPSIPLAQQINYSLLRALAVPMGKRLSRSLGKLGFKQSNEEEENHLQRISDVESVNRDQSNSQSNPDLAETIKTAVEEQRQHNELGMFV